MSNDNAKEGIFFHPQQTDYTLFDKIQSAYVISVWMPQWFEVLTLLLLLTINSEVAVLYVQKSSTNKVDT